MRAVVAFVLCLLGGLTWPAALSAASSGPADSGSTKLTFELANELMNVVTPCRAMTGGSEMKIAGESGTIDICGSQVAVNVAMNPQAAFIGLDVNGNGKVDPNEMQKINHGDAAFKLKIGEKDKKEYAVVLKGVNIISKEKVIEGATARYFTANCFKGTINGVTVRLIDDNLDGKITQDGSDAIVIGQSQYALPLLKQHTIGNAIYELKVADDGASLEFTKQTAKLAQVEVPLLKSPGVGCVIVVDQANGRAFDLVTSKSGIPAGSYKLSYGTIGQGKDQLQIRPTTASPTYELQEDMLNVLKMGPAFKVQFMAGYNEAKNEVTVFPRVSVVGAGKEVYNVSLSGLKPPQVTFTEGTKVVSREGMSFG